MVSQVITAFKSFGKTIQAENLKGNTIDGTSVLISLCAACCTNAEQKVN